MSHHLSSLVRPPRPRRKDSLLLDQDIIVHTVGSPAPGARARNFVEVHFTSAAGASTPCEWRVVVNHTRSGSGAMKIPGGTAEKRLRFKSNVLTRAVQVATKDPRMPAFVVGDFNMTQ